MITVFIFGTCFGVCLSYLIGSAKAKKADKKRKKEEKQNGDISTDL